MYLNLGREVTVPFSSVLSVIDMDTATWSRHTRAMIAELERSGRVIPVFDDLPKSGVLCAENGQISFYISQLSSATILKRSSSPF